MRSFDPANTSGPQYSMRDSNVSSSAKVPETWPDSGDLLRRMEQEMQQTPVAQSPTSVRVWAAVGLVGGAAESGVGAAALIAPEPTGVTKVGGAYLVAHGADTMGTSMAELVSGEHQEKLFHRAIRAGVGTVTDNQAVATGAVIASEVGSLGVGIGVARGMMGAAGAAGGAAGATEGAFSPIAQGGGLTAHEAAGGHLLARHVGLDAKALDARGINMASTFLTRMEAESAASAALSENATAISVWLKSGATSDLKVTTAFNGGLIRVPGGYEATATAAKFILRSNQTQGFFILTGFPTP